MHPNERTAWVWLACLVTAPSLYFLLGKDFDWALSTYDLNRLATLAVPLVFMAVAALSVKLFNVRQALVQDQKLVDERDKLIDSRASAVAYQVLMIGMIVVGFVLPFSATRWEMIDTSFFAIVVAEIVHSAMIVRAYRNGIHV
jgi:uncharacterized membrane protein